MTNFCRIILKDDRITFVSQLKKDIFQFFFYFIAQATIDRPDRNQLDACRKRSRRRTIAAGIGLPQSNPVCPTRKVAASTTTDIFGDRSILLQFRNRPRANLRCPTTKCEMIQMNGVTQKLVSHCVPFFITVDNVLPLRPEHMHHGRLISELLILAIQCV